MIPTETVLYLLLFGATLTASALGLVIVFQAYRGYRRNDSRPMLFVAIGFVLLTLVPFTLQLSVPVFAPGLVEQPFVLSLLTRLFEIAGLAIILYSLYDRTSG